MVLLDGKRLSDLILHELQGQVGRFVHQNDHPPGLATLIVGDNPASHVYVGRKMKACEKIGIKGSKNTFPQNVSLEHLSQKIKSLNEDPRVHGILVQLPLPAQLNVQEVLGLIAPQKDVDGLGATNQGNMLLSLPGSRPCTPLGVIRLLESYQVPLKGKHAVVLGRSHIVGKPLANMLIEKHATVTVCHSQTPEVELFTRQADVVLVAMGQPQKVKATWVKEGAAVVDVGIHKNAQGHIVGDVDFEDVKSKAGWITPVPGGVGPMTIAMLMENTLRAAFEQCKK